MWRPAILSSWAMRRCLDRQPALQNCQLQQTRQQHSGFMLLSAAKHVKIFLQI